MAPFLGHLTTPPRSHQAIRVTAHDLVSAQTGSAASRIPARSICSAHASPRFWPPKGKPGHRLPCSTSAKCFEASPAFRDKALFANKLAVLIDSVCRSCAA